MNELANMAECLGADIENVRLGIGYHFIYPGCGYGGSCFPKDVQALERTAKEIGYDAPLLQAVETINNRQKNVLFQKINTHFDGDLKDKTFAIWGLAFKPKTNDMRAAPSRTLMEALWEAGAKVQAYDPEAMQEAHRIYGDRPDLTLCENANNTLTDADVLIIVTEWQAFRSPDFGLIKNQLKSPTIFDGRNIYEPSTLSNLGFTYYAIGRN